MKLNDYIDWNLLVEMIEKDYVEKKYSPCGNFFLLDYTRNATFDNVWNDATVRCRGLVVDSNTCDIVGFCIPKFHNIQESADHHLRAYKECVELDVPFEATEKMDGSFGNIWWDKYQGQYRCSTRGSFTSDQALWATEFINKKYIVRGNTNFNVIVEIIYPENRIVIDYGDRKDLVLLTGFKSCGEEFRRYDTEVCGSFWDLPVVPIHRFNSIEEIVEKCETLDGNHEGYVLRFDNDFRIKIKGKEYCNLHKIISGLSTKSVWENIDPISLEINKEWLLFVPEEFRPDVEQYAESLIKDAKRIYDLTRIQYSSLVVILPAGYTKKDFVMSVKNVYPKDLSALIMLHEGKHKELQKRIWENIKPEFRKLSCI